MESHEELVKHFEELTGRKFHTREDIRAYLEEVAAGQAAREAVLRRRWSMVKHMALYLSLALAFLQYYLVDALYQVVTLNQVTVFVPVKARDLKSEASDDLDLVLDDSLDRVQLPLVLGQLAELQKTV